MRKYFNNVLKQLRSDKKSFIIYTILRVLVLGILIRSIWVGNYESAAICVLSLVLFLLPAAVETTFKIEIPTVFEIIIYAFIFAAEILGEIFHYYVLVPGWDTMLHTLNGFLCAAVGLSLVDLLNQRSEKINLSPLYVALAAFCFSMTIGVLWEFFEFGVDHFLNMDMQKDAIVTSINSVTLDPEGGGALVHIKDITNTVITTGSGETYIIEGYLDIGIWDTMKDLFVNFIGAVVFSVLGFFYTKNRGFWRRKKQDKFVEGLLVHKNKKDDESDAGVDETSLDDASTQV